MPIYELYYDDHLVCDACGKQDYHINFSFHLPEEKLYYDQEYTAWCHICSKEATLVEEVGCDL